MAEAILLFKLAETYAESNPQIVVTAVESFIAQANPENKLSAFHLLDSIVKTIGGDYPSLFAQNIASLFRSALFEVADMQTRQKMLELRETWSGVFPERELHELDSLVHSFELVEMHRDVSIDDFKPIAFLGNGSFGHVMLAQRKTGGEFFAIKTMEKANCYQHIQLQRNEMKIFDGVNPHPFLVNFLATFETNSHLCFLMEYAAGGDLRAQMLATNVFSEQCSIFYASCVILGLQYLHDNNIAHRDIKLDNLLLNHDGYVKISDFGTSKKGVGCGDRMYSMSGTPIYMAPEMFFLNDFSYQPYTRVVDWWAFGITFLEMLVGKVPAPCHDKQVDLLDSDDNQDLIPESISIETITTIRKLLRTDPERRLGSSERGAEDVKEEAAFRQMNWEDMIARRVPAPFIPNGFTEDVLLDTNREELLPDPCIMIDDDQFHDFDYTPQKWLEKETVDQEPKRKVKWETKVITKKNTGTVVINTREYRKAKTPTSKAKFPANPVPPVKSEDKVTNKEKVKNVKSATRPPWRASPKIVYAKYESDAEFLKNKDQNKDNSVKKTKVTKKDKNDRPLWNASKRVDKKVLDGPIKNVAVKKTNFSRTKKLVDDRMNKDTLGKIRAIHY